MNEDDGVRGNDSAAPRRTPGHQRRHTHRGRSARPITPPPPSPPTPPRPRSPLSVADALCCVVCASLSGGRQEVRPIIITSPCACLLYHCHPLCTIRVLALSTRRHRSAVATDLAPGWAAVPAPDGSGDTYYWHQPSGETRHGRRGHSHVPLYIPCTILRTKQTGAREDDLAARGRRAGETTWDRPASGARGPNSGSAVLRWRKSWQTRWTARAMLRSGGRRAHFSLFFFHFGPNSAFSSCVPTEMHGPTCIFWANLAPFSLHHRAQPQVGSSAWPRRRRRSSGPRCEGGPCCHSARRRSVPAGLHVSETGVQQNDRWPNRWESQARIGTLK
jgi:hypothetical protein